LALSQTGSHLTGHYWEDMRLNRLVRVLPKWCLPPVPVWAVMPMRRYLPAKTRAFLAHLEQFIEKG